MDEEREMGKKGGREGKGRGERKVGTSEKRKQ